VTQPTDMPKEPTGLGLLITNKAMSAHLSSPRRFTEGPATVSIWGRIWWKFVAKTGGLRG